MKFFPSVSFAVALASLVAARAGSPAARAVRRSELGKRSSEGGNVNIINGTPWALTLSDSSAYQLDSSWPSSIPAYSSVQVHLEWKTGLFVNTGDSAGHATYTLDGTSSSFQIQASGSGGYNLNAVLSGMSTVGNAQGATIQMGWEHDGWVNFALAGTDLSNLISSNPPVDWMTQSLATFGNTTLGQFVLPASHDTGMSTLDGTTAGARDCNTETQSLGIADQLAKGARYFDIRPVISGGVYKTGHYSALTVESITTWQGGNGQSITDIINAVNDFTQGKSELIILNLSHDLNTDVGNSDYRPLNQDEYNALFTQLQGINNLYHSAAADTDLTKLTLNDFLANGSAVVIVVQSDGGVNFDSIRGQGFFTYDQLGPFNSYADSADLNTMWNDQVTKMQDNASGYFLFSNTLTQDAEGAILCPAADSIISLANTANGKLFSDMMSTVTKDAYPKFLFIDDFAYSDIIPLALGIQHKVSP